MPARLVFMRRLPATWVVFFLVALTVSDRSASAQSNNAAAYTFSTFAGSTGLGYADGVGTDARFYHPFGVAVDTNGNVYVSEEGNVTIRKITPAGVVSTIAGFPGTPGTNDGINGAARFGDPEGIAVDGAGNLYVADSANNSIRKITPAGSDWVVSTIAGISGGQYFGGNDGTNNAARFQYPSGITLDASGQLFVVDNFGDTVRKLTPFGTNWVVTTIAGLYHGIGSTDGTNSAARFNGPRSLAVDSAGRVYVGDQGNQTIRKLTPVGTNWVVTTIAGSLGNTGSTDGTNTVARFSSPYGLAVDGATNVYVVDGGNQTIRKLTPIGTNWVSSTIAGSVGYGGSTDGTGTNALFSLPKGLAADNAGNLYVAEIGNNEIRKINSAGVVSTLAGTVVSQRSADGSGASAQFNSPQGVATDSAGNVYVADATHNTIRKITTAGLVTTLAGLADTSGNADGVGSNARFYNPSGVALESNGNVLVADTYNYRIRAITPEGVVTTLVGSTAGSTDGTNGAARFSQPRGVAVDNGKNFYVADTGNHTIRRVRLVSPTNWAVTTIAGLAGVSGSADGTNSAARFNSPYALTVDDASNIYVVESGSYAIRRITPVGTNWVVTTIAGVAGTYGIADGTNNGARFGFILGGPRGIDVDSEGNLFVADTYNDLIRKLTPSGTNWLVSTVGGLPVLGGPVGSRGSTDGAGSDARFYLPTGIALDDTGNIYIVDSANNTIRKGEFTAYGNTNPAAYTPPAMNVGLKVVLLPPEANGQWRFPWEVAWRNSGQSANNLVAGNYSVEFRNVPGWLAVPSGYDVVAVTNNGTTLLTNFYYPTLTAVDTNSGGSLTVNIGPSPPGGVGWRFLGDTTPYFPTGYRTNLVTGIYLIEFAPVAGFSQPPSQAVQVLPGLPTVLSVTYRLASTPPGGVQLPFPVPPANLNNPGSYPFAFNGQLQTDIGYGSGVAVDANVVLTAAHLIFNDQSLSYVNQTWWFFQRQAGVFEPLPLSARSIYMLTGYASQRTNDVRGGLGPEQSSPQSRNFDVAALYFDAPVAGGGYGGYLPSDAVPNPWLTGNSLKMLAGYPVDGSQFGVSIVPGKMYQTTPQPYALNLASDQVTNQQVYTASWFLSYPGNSGGPLYAQLNGYYYPAAVYLGTLYNGVVPYASVVRAIDSNVVNLITLAATQGATGTNHSGGGVITIVPNQSISAANPGYVQFTLSPPAAVAAGAGWRLSGDTAYSSATNYTRAVLTTNAFSVQFQPVAGWNVPTNQAITVQPGQINYGSAFYTVTNPMLMASGAALGLTGTTGTMYRLERRSSLTSGSWQPVSTNTISSGGFNLFLANPATNGSVNFYRAVWLP